MRWQNLELDVSDAAAPPLPVRGAAARTFDTPSFRGMTFFEIRARSILNRVPASSRVPFRWTVNPYRGCSHACVYCFARGTHTYLDLDAGLDFDSKIVVKVNAPELLRRELAAARWQGEHVALGTNVDPYQRAEGKYRLMRGILEAFRDAANPFSVLTKGTLVLRDLDLLVECAEVAEVGMAVSVGSVDRELCRSVEPGAPSPLARLDVCRALTEAGIGCSVLLAPVLPGLSDGEEALTDTVRAIAAAGARSVTPLALHLRPGAREWYLAWLAREHPSLVERYEGMYGRGAYAPAAYQRDLTERVRRLARRFGVGRRPGAATARTDRPRRRASAGGRPPRTPPAAQLSLL